MYKRHWLINSRPLPMIIPAINAGYDPRQLTTEMLVDAVLAMPDAPNAVDGIIRRGGKNYDQSGKELSND